MTNIGLTSLFGLSFFFLLYVTYYSKDKKKNKAFSEVLE